MRLLLAEDEQALSRALVTILERNNYSVDAVYDGQAALDYLEADNYDGVILDIMMPKVDGMTVLKTIRAAGNPIPVLLLTAKGEVDDKVSGLDAGANDYLTKPFHMREDPVFVELKKKYQSVVYKRRLVLPQAQVMDSFAQDTPLPIQSQIGEEIQYFRAYYGNLRPVVFLSYEREAYYDRFAGKFRVTFDEEILYRQRDLSLGSGVYGTPLLKPGYTLMELKTAGGLPLWMSHVLNRCAIYKTSFSKYGAAYQDMMAAHTKGGLRYA